MSLLPLGVSSVQARSELPDRYRVSYIDAEVLLDQAVPLHVVAAVYQVIAQTSYLYLITTHFNDASTLALEVRYGIIPHLSGYAQHQH